MAHVTLEHVDIGYGHSDPVVRGLSLDVRHGAFTAMVGPSGSGKTSILRAIGGFVTPRSGRVLLDGKDMTATRPERRNLGIVFQDYALFPHMDVRANIAFGLRMRHAGRSETSRKVGDALDLVDLAGFEHRYPDELSGGQQQRVALARALVTEPTALLLDEPLSALDRKIRLEMQLELKRIQRATGITAIIVTHDQQEALALGDELVVLADGKIAQVGNPHEVYDRPGSEFVAGFLGTVNLFGAQLVDAAADRIRLGEMIVDGVRVVDDVRAGEAARVAIRPERITVEDAASGPQRPGVAFAGTLTTILLSGQTADCEFDTALGKVLVSVLSPQAATMSVGARCTLAVAPDDIHVFRSTSADAARADAAPVRVQRTSVGR